MKEMYHVVNVENISIVFMNISKAFRVSTSPTPPLNVPSSDVRLHNG